jgi:aryl-alcohol dehydrogenase-like predicted oxidoreductase
MDKLSNNRHSLIRYTPINGQDRSQPLPYDPRSDIKRQVHDSCSKSLENLRTSYIDSYILHSPLSTMEHTLEAWKALCELQDSGVVKSIGMSNVYDG